MSSTYLLQGVGAWCGTTIPGDVVSGKENGIKDLTPGTAGTLNVSPGTEVCTTTSSASDETCVAGVQDPQNLARADKFVQR